MKAVRFHPDARAELLAAGRFYRDERPGLARAFASEFGSAVERILQFPQSGNPSSGEDQFRRVTLNRFPFSVVYRVGAEEIFVLAVMHDRRQPQYWKGRAE